MLLFNCFPERILDAKSLLAEFKTVDADGSGLVSFEEFLRYYGELLLPQAGQLPTPHLHLPPQPSSFQHVHHAARP